jgi:hypothetical protein
MASSPSVLAAHLARCALDDDVTQRDLTVTAYRHLQTGGGLTPYADDGRTVKLFHDAIVPHTPGHPTRQV